MALMDFNLGDVGSVFTSVREAITGEKIVDPIKQAELSIKMDMIESGLKKAQMLVNQTEAQHPSVFVAGWRPFIGWVGGVGLAYHFVVQPILFTILRANDIIFELPELEMMDLMMLIGGMLGFGGFRTFEKVRGRASGE